MKKEAQAYEVIIVGGSYSGLSAALALGRSWRSTLVIDSGKPCNQQTPHSQNFLTRDGQPPAEIAAIGKEQLKSYQTVEFLNALAVKGDVLENRMVITTDTGERYSAKKLIFATGIYDQLLAIPGFTQCWGISVIHCPYCHGFEYRNKRTGILANGESALHYAQLVSNLTHDLVILTDGPADIEEKSISLLRKKGIPVIEKVILELEHSQGYLQKVLFVDHSTLPLDALYARVPFRQHSDIPKSLGCTITDQGYIETNMLHKTTVPHVFASGDNSSPMRSIANAVASGNMAGAMVNMELCKEEFNEEN